MRCPAINPRREVLDDLYEKKAETKATATEADEMMTEPTCPSSLLAISIFNTRGMAIVAALGHKMPSPGGQVSRMAGEEWKAAARRGTSCHPVDLHKGYRTVSRGRYRGRVRLVRMVAP